MPPLIRPGKPYYLIGLILLVLAGFAADRFYRLRLEAVPPDLVQVVVPGSVDLDFPRPGHGTIFLEYRSAVGDRYFLTPDDPGRLACTLTSRDTGAAIDLQGAWLPVRYTLERRSGLAIFDFWVGEPGAYTLSGKFPPGSPGTSMVLAGGYGVLGDLSGTVLGSLGAVAGLAIAGLVSVSVVAVRRGRSRRGIYGRFGR